jgi:oxalate decarboxylase/phosphoglucose isomerase-like protein (cupin superfamily)
VFKTIPAEELYIFPASESAILEYLDLFLLCEDPPETADAPKDPQGTVDNPFSFSFSQVKPTKLSGGSVKIVDSTTFKISKTIAAAEVTVEPGAMR